MYIPAKIKTNLKRILQKSLLFLFLYLSKLYFLSAQGPNKNVKQEKQEIQDSLILSGYWEAQVIISKKEEIQIKRGTPYYWNSIQVYEGQIPIEIASVEKLINQIANQRKINKKLQDYVTLNYHRKGYPLAKAELIISDVKGSQVDALIKISKQNYIVYDTLQIKGDSQTIQHTYLSHLLRIGYNEPFDISEFQSIERKIEQINFLKLGSPPKLSFANNKAEVELDLRKLKINQFDAIVGLIPDGDRTNLTGQVDARLRNLFKRGVNFDVFWQKYSVNSQFLKTNVRQSHAFKSPLGVDLGFELLQEDSTFLQADLQIGTEYMIREELGIGFAYQRLTNNVLRTFTNEEVSPANPFRSSISNALLLNLHWRNELTYPQLKNYVNASLNLSLGSKQINNFSELPEIWQNVPEISSNLQGGIKLQVQKVLGKRFLIEAIPQYAAIQNPALSQNDLLRLGGLQNLRGFDRNFFYSQYFAMLNLNYRYFLDNSSSFFLLTDIARLDSNINWVYSTGAGMDIKSRNGWFRIIYAIGNQRGNILDFTQGKVHFGYIAIF